jgi:hypothetical protein
LAQVFAATNLLSDALSHYQAALRYTFPWSWNCVAAMLNCRKASYWNHVLALHLNHICIQSCAFLLPEPLSLRVTYGPLSPKGSIGTVGHQTCLIECE